MKNKRYFDSFQKYEECFNKIWDKFPVGDKPEWRHWWFYRYLQISPSYIAWTDGMAKTRKGGELPDRCIDIPGLSLVAQTQYMFGDVLYLDFTRWWYAIARFQFNKNLFKGNEIKEIFQWPNRIEIPEKDLNEAKVNLDNLYKEMKSSQSYPSVVGISIPIQSSLKKTMQGIEKFLKDNYPFGEESKVESNFSFFKSKMKEHSISDCYKSLEIRCDQNEADLVEVAIESDTLKSAMADLKAAKFDTHKMRSAESLRSGTSRQISTAILIAENAARGRFPCYDPIPILDPDYKELKKVFGRLKKPERFRSFNLRDITYQVDYTIKNPSPEEWHFLKKFR